MAEYTKKQMALIDANRDYNTDHNWWEPTYDFFTDTAIRFGLSVERNDIEFSGFWSQGDGACFEFERTNLGAILVACHNALDELELPSPNPLVYAFLGIYNAIVDCIGTVMAHLQPRDVMDVLEDIIATVEKHSGPYCHSGMRYVEFDYGAMADDGAMARVLGTSGPDLQKTLTERVAHVADCLYCMLKEEYDYLTSDEAVWESMVANNFAGVNRVAA